MTETAFDKLGPVRMHKPRLMGLLIQQYLEAIRDEIDADNSTVVAAMTAASGEASLEAAQAALATAISDANTQSAARVSAINAELAKLTSVIKSL